MEELKQQPDALQKLTDLKKTYEKQILVLTKTRSSCSENDRKEQINTILARSKRGLKRAQDYIDTLLDVYQHKNFDKLRHDPELLQEVDKLIANAQEILNDCHSLSVFVEQNNTVI